MTEKTDADTGKYWKLIYIKRKQKEKNRQYLESIFISNEVGEQFSLQELSDRSVSNPAIRVNTKRLCRILITKRFCRARPCSFLT
ncbi:replication endonuclease [Nitrosomonas aestuarii]|uniref:replication endonuclease n=1 Tax=Nitrosomonas aestuarii TaxID=52441 RepID=UPI001FD26BF3|nr:replication endonuclease [Nitrosomonas aestuarii]